jgi:hypothetical protein
VKEDFESKTFVHITVTDQMQNKLGYEDRLKKIHAELYLAKNTSSLNNFRGNEWERL